MFTRKTLLSTALLLTLPLLTTGCQTLSAADKSSICKVLGGPHKFPAAAVAHFRDSDRVREKDAVDFWNTNCKK